MEKINNTENHNCNITNLLREIMFSEIGKAYCYMYFWHKDVFDENDCGQRKRVEDLITDFCNNEKQNYNNISWYCEQITKFQNETENMC